MRFLSTRFSVRIFRIFLAALLLTGPVPGGIPPAGAGDGIPLPRADPFAAEGVLGGSLRLTGLRFRPDHPLHFDFIVDTGTPGLDEDLLKTAAESHIRYFLSALTVPEDAQWVNLSPGESDRVIPGVFGKTGLGRDLLVQDYVLKQTTASLLDPEDPVGARVWERVYARLSARGGVPELTELNQRVWIVPESARVYENGSEVYVTEARLGVRLEVPAGESSTPEDEAALRDHLLPELERAVNEAPRFTRLRQMYRAMILATWFKRKLKDSLLGEIYVGRGRTAGTGVEGGQSAMEIYESYMDLYRQGAYRRIIEDYDPARQRVVSRAVASGGTRLGMDLAVRLDTGGDPARLVEEKQGDWAMLATDLSAVLPEAITEETTPSEPNVISSGNDAASLTSPRARFEPGDTVLLTLAEGEVLGSVQEYREDGGLIMKLSSADRRFDSSQVRISSDDIPGSVEKISLPSGENIPVVLKGSFSGEKAILRALTRRRDPDDIKKYQVIALLERDQPFVPDEQKVLQIPIRQWETFFELIDIASEKNLKHRMNEILPDRIRTILNESNRHWSARNLQRELRKLFKKEGEGEFARIIQEHHVKAVIGRDSRLKGHSRLRLSTKAARPGPREDAAQLAEQGGATLSIAELSRPLPVPSRARNRKAPDGDHVEVNGMTWAVDELVSIRSGSETVLGRIISFPFRRVGGQNRVFQQKAILQTSLGTHLEIPAIELNQTAGKISLESLTQDPAYYLDISVPGLTQERKNQLTAVLAILNQSPEPLSVEELYQLASNDPETRESWMIYKDVEGAVESADMFPVIRSFMVNVVSQYFLIAFHPRLLRTQAGYVVSRKTSRASGAGESSDQASLADSQKSENPGGIDFDPAGLEIESAGPGADVELAPDLERLRTMPLEGFLPVITDVIPIPSVPLLLGLTPQSPVEREETSAGPLASSVRTNR